MEILFNGLDGVQEYCEEAGRGFVGEAGTFPKRKVDLSRIECREEGVYVREDERPTIKSQ